MTPVLTVTIVMAAVVFPAAVGAAIAVTMVIILAHVVAERATSTAASRRADQATGVSAYAASDDVAAGRAQGPTEGCFAAAVLVGTYRTTCGATQASAYGRASAATDLLANYGTENPTQGAADTCFGGTAGKGRAADQAQRQRNNRGKLHERNLRLMTARSCNGPLLVTTENRRMTRACHKTLTYCF